MTYEQRLTDKFPKEVAVVKECMKVLGITVNITSENTLYKISGAVDLFKNSCEEDSEQKKYYNNVKKAIHILINSKIVASLEYEKLKDEIKKERQKTFDYEDVKTQRVAICCYWPDYVEVFIKGYRKNLKIQCTDALKAAYVSAIMDHLISKYPSPKLETRDERKVEFSVEETYTEALERCKGAFEEDKEHRVRGLECRLKALEETLEE